MKRKKQIIIYLLLVVLCVGGYMWINGLWWSPKAVFVASQKMNHVGPVDEILTEVDCGDGKYAILGRDGENLYFCMMEQKKGIFWRRVGAEYFTRAYLEQHDQIIQARYYDDWDFVFGICRESEGKEVSFQIKEGEEEVVLLEGKLPVRKDGIFFGKVEGGFLHGKPYLYIDDNFKKRIYNGEKKRFLLYLCRREERARQKARASEALGHTPFLYR